MGILGSIFTWWNGATISTRLHTWRKGRRVGTDSYGNTYYESRDGARRWVIYDGSNDASRVAPEWHGWLHGTLRDLPDVSLPPVRGFETAPEPNLTGTGGAYLPAGALEHGGRRAAASGDYEAWSPGA